MSSNTWSSNTWSSKTRTALKGLVLGWTLALPSMGNTSEAPSLLSLREFLETSLQVHQTQEEHVALAESARLGLKQGERYYWPEITARTGYDEITTDTAASKTAPASETIDQGVTTGLDTTWTSWIGTDLSLGLEHQYGRQLGKVSQGIPEEELQAHTLSVEVSQPLLKQNSIGYNRLELKRARNQWQQYQVEGDLNQLTVLRDALLDYLAVQEQHDRVQLQYNQMEHARFLLGMTETLASEGRSLVIDTELAALDVRREEQATTTARLRYQQSQQQITLPWTANANIRVQPQPSVAAFIDLLRPVLSHETSQATPLNRHPEYQQQALTLDAAQLEEYAVRRDRWPDVSAFYRYEKNFREVLPDEETQAWGLKFSYALFDLPTREQQARRRAEVTIAQWNTDDQLKRLEWESSRLVQNCRTLNAELALHEQGLQLAQKALDHEQARYREGLSSYPTVQQRQQDVLDRQLAALTTQVELAQGLINLAYYRQWDWLNRLP